MHTNTRYHVFIDSDGIIRLCRLPDHADRWVKVPATGLWSLFRRNTAPLGSPVEGGFTIDLDSHGGTAQRVSSRACY